MVSVGFLGVEKRENPSKFFGKSFSKSQSVIPFSSIKKDVFSSSFRAKIPICFSKFSLKFFSKIFILSAKKDTSQKFINPIETDTLYSIVSS